MFRLRPPDPRPGLCPMDPAGVGDYGPPDPLPAFKNLWPPLPPPPLWQPGAVTANGKPHPSFGVVPVSTTLNFTTPNPDFKVNDIHSFNGIIGTYTPPFIIRMILNDSETFSDAKH